MKPYYEDESIVIYCGDSREFKGKADVIVTDPPYGLEFMGKEWDCLGKGWNDRASATKTGQDKGDFSWFGGNVRPRYGHNGPAMQEWHYEWASHLLGKAGWLFAFGGTRTWHRLACAIEDAGWQYRDTIMWLYGQGFPKGKNNLKPAWEPILVARKYGDLDIDAARIGGDGGCKATTPHCGGDSRNCYGNGLNKPSPTPRVDSLGRWPANLVLDEEAGKMLDEQSGERPSGAMTKPYKYTNNGNSLGAPSGFTKQIHGANTGGASRFFYCANADEQERGRRPGGFGNVGASKGDPKPNGPMYDDDGGPSRFYYCAKASKAERGEGNDHPTVKPLKLMEWLIKLSGGQLILDPFMGSGTTLVAAKRLGRKAIGIDIDEHSCEIAANRCRQTLI